MAYFVPNFLLIIFLKSILVYQVPPTQKIAKIKNLGCKNQKNRDFKVKTWSKLKSVFFIGFYIKKYIF